MSDTFANTRLSARVRGLPPVPASAGADTLETPRPVLDVVGAALRAGETHYTARPGLPELRRRLAERIADAGGPAYGPEGVVVTSGVREGLFAILLGCQVRSGTVALTSADGPRLAALFRFVGLEPLAVPAGREIPVEARLVYRDGAETAAVRRWLAEDEGEGVRQIVEVDGIVGALAIAPEDAARTIIVGEASPASWLSRFAVGFVAGPPDRMAGVKVWKQAFSICTAAPSQRAACAWLSDDGR